MKTFQETPNRKQRYDKVINTLYEDCYFVAAEIAKLGNPDFSDEIPTAAVAYSEEKSEIEYLFNKKFFDLSTDEELAFVMAHETNHVVRCHPMFYNKKAEELKAQGKTTKEINEFIKKLNIAADCIINDYLVNVCKMNKPQNFEPKFGKDVVGVDCEDLELMQVFRMIPKNYENNSDEFGDAGDVNWKSFKGHGESDVLGDLKKIVEKYNESSTISDDDALMLENLSDNLSKISPGNQPVGSFIPITKLGTKSINWASLLFKFVSSKKIEEKWNRQPRKMVSIYPNVVLPVSTPRDKISLFLAIDTSGSISYSSVSLFIELAKNTPKDFDISAITFDTQCYKYNIREGQMPRGGGGTSFSNIEWYIKENLKKYPNIIVVLTDGCGGHIFPKYPKRWCWLLYGGHTSEYIKNMKHFLLKDLIK